MYYNLHYNNSFRPYLYILITNATTKHTLRRQTINCVHGPVRIDHQASTRYRTKPSMRIG